MSTPSKKVMSRQHLSRQLQRKEEIGDLWFDQKECIEDNIEEVEEKWENLDDEVWGKMIVMNKNQRVGKVLLRKPTVVINNSEQGYDHQGIVGLNGLVSRPRDRAMDTLLGNIGTGCKVGIDAGGNITCMKLNNKCQIYRSEYGAQSSVPLANDVKQEIFDMKKFQSLLRKEAKKETVDWDKVKLDTVCILCFGDPSVQPLSQYLWVIVINVVALDLLRARKERSDNSSSGSDTVTSESTETNGSNKTPSKVTKPMPKGHPMSWHQKPPVPPVRQSSRLI